MQRKTIVNLYNQCFNEAFNVYSTNIIQIIYTLHKVNIFEDDNTCNLVVVWQHEAIVFFKK